MDKYESDFIAFLLYQHDIEIMGTLVAISIKQYGAFSEEASQKISEIMEGVK